MPLAYSYKRFSSEKQAQGDSLRRQTALAESYIQRHPELNLVLDEDRSLTDAGMSAYKGVHIKRGALAVFLRAVEDGQIEEGCYLLVESLDRLSRQQPVDALQQLMALIQAGVVVVTLNDEKVYSKATLQGLDGTFVLMASLIGMSRAFEESDTKGRRVRAAWANKFKQIEQGKQLTKRVPFWLNEDRTVKPDRVSVVQRVFGEYAQGFGTTVITKRLNADGVAPPSSKALTWGDSSVKKLLRSSAAIGVLTTADGQRHEGYYPAVISDELFFSCQLKIPNGGRSRGGSLTPQPLAGLLRCSCGHGSIIRVTKTGNVRKDGTKKLFESVACSHAKVGGAGCVYKSFPYQGVLKAIEQNVPEIQELASSTSNMEEVRNLDGYLFELSDKVQDAYDIFKQTKQVTARDRFQELAKELEELKAERERLIESVGSVGSAVTEMLMAKPEMTHQWLSKVFRGGVLDLWGEKMLLTLQNGKTLELELKGASRSDAL